MKIEISGLTCRYGSTPALEGVDLVIGSGSFVALLGPSGAGKTTLLRLLAGLESPESDEILFDGRDAVPIPVNRRRIGFVFQQYALFRHMTVARNIAFGLDVRRASDRPSRAEIDRRVTELLDLVQLPGYGDRLPHQLSGGQRQRVALARALAIDPQVLLLDEPFGALDVKVRTEMRGWLKTLQRQLGITAVFVTHDQSEAMELADEIVVMRNGKIQQKGSPEELYREPRSGFVFGFLGDANALPCTVTDNVAWTIDGRFLTNGLAAADGPATSYFRPHETELANPDENGVLDGIVVDVLSHGPRRRIILETLGTRIALDIPGRSDEPAAQLGVGAACHWRPRHQLILRD